MAPLKSPSTKRFGNEELILYEERSPRAGAAVPAHHRGADRLLIGPGISSAHSRRCKARRFAGKASQPQDREGFVEGSKEEREHAALAGAVKRFARRASRDYSAMA